MSTVNKQSRRRRALAHVQNRIEVWQSASQGTLTVFPDGFDRDADPERKLAQAQAEEASLQHALRGAL